MNKRSINYIHDFIFEQKCIPWRLRNLCKYERIKEQIEGIRKKITLEMKLRNIPLENLYTGGVTGDKPFDGVNSLLHQWYPNRKMKESCHVKFLQEFKDAEEINRGKFKKSAYFHLAQTDIQNTGSFFGVSSENKVIERAEYFLKLYHAIKTKSCIRSFRDVATDNHSKNNNYPKVTRIRHSNYYVIRDGHHRCAAYYVLGKLTIKAEVIGWSRVSLKDIARKRILYDNQHKIL